MGTCGSVHHHRSSSSSPQSTPAAAMKLNDSFRSNLVMPPSPIKPKFFTTTFKSFGSKDENFFDSQTYLESDCEDDFYSVNGDFTPSRGTTPVHHSFSAGIVNKTSLTTPEPSPRKRLSELFLESENTDNDLQNTAGTNPEVKQTVLNILPKSSDETPYVSGPNSLCSSERTANGENTLESEKSHWSMHGCLPNMVSCRGISPRKKKMTPVVPTVAKV